MKQRRFDAGRLGKIERTPQGGVRVPAALTRTGVLIYRNPDGSTRRELRPAEEVFRADSLATLRSAPVTEGHGAWVSPENYQSVALGHVADSSVRQDGELVAAELVIQSGAALPRLDSGDLHELSCGYTLDFDPTPGVWNGQRYDGVQRNIRYNHVALLPRGGGRAGRDVALRLDAADAAACEDSPAFPAGNDPGNSRKEKTMIIRLDGKDYDLSKPEDVAALNTANAKVREDAAAARAEAATARGELEREKGRADQAVADLKKERDGFQARLDSAVSERVELRASAARVLGAEYEFRRKDGADKSAREIMLDVIRADDKDFSENDAAGKPRSDEYLRARYDAVTESGRRADSIDNAPAVLRQAREQRNDQRDPADSNAARQRMIEANRTAWQPKGTN